MKAELLKFQEKRQLQLFVRKYGPSYGKDIDERGWRKNKYLQITKVMPKWSKILLRLYKET